MHSFLCVREQDRFVRTPASSGNELIKSLVGVLQTSTGLPEEEPRSVPRERAAPGVFFMVFVQLVRSL